MVGLEATLEAGMGMSRSGLENKAVRWEACWLVGERARFLVGRLERGSIEVGMDSGMGSDILFVCVYVSFDACAVCVGENEALLKCEAILIDV